ncbi:MAG: beta-N-acetylhexosaminidase, partial [Methyloligellaceae bacterium]
STVRACVAGGELLILVDQEGGRVQRMGPPQWRIYPAARNFGRLYDSDPEEGVNAARAVARLMAKDLFEAGINTDCAPVLDLPAPGAHEIIGDRAYGSDPETVIALARSVAEGLLDGGVLPVIKHIPGHGRARADSHEKLPVISASREELSETDFKPFAALNDLPLAMTAHVVLSAVDDVAPASVSAPIISQVIRKQIGFGGLVMSDDLDMAALTGTPAERARSVIAAGCDVVLHCSGKLADMAEVADATPELSAAALARLKQAFGQLQAPVAFDEDRAESWLKKALVAVA